MVVIFGLIRVVRVGQGQSQGWPGLIRLVRVGWGGWTSSYKSTDLSMACMNIRYSAWYCASSRLAASQNSRTVYFAHSSAPRLIGSSGFT